MQNVLSSLVVAAASAMSGIALAADGTERYPSKTVRVVYRRRRVAASTSWRVSTRNACRIPLRSSSS